VRLTPDQLAQICSEGIQFDANKLQAGQGSGLGLYISKGLVEQHLGKLTVASDGPGKGASFFVELPLFRRAATTSPTQKGNTFGSSGQKTSSTLIPAPCARRVLVVDDAASNRKMLVRLLKSRGFVCEQAEDGQQAVELYRALQGKGELVDIIVMDYEMHVMNGPTATKTLRDLGCTCLIVGVTGNLLPEDVNYFKTQGADAVLGKPLNMKLFEEVLSQHQQKASEGMGFHEEKKSGNNSVFTEEVRGIEMV